MDVMNDLSWWSRYGFDRYGYGSTFQDVLVHSTTHWWKAWEWHLALTSMIALCTGIVCVSLHLILPRADRPHE